MPSRAFSIPLWLLLCGLTPLFLSGPSLASTMTASEKQTHLMNEAQVHLDALDKLVGQVKDPALREPLNRSVRDLRATIEELNKPGNGSQVSLPRQGDPVAFNPPTAEVQVGLNNPGSVPIVVAVEVPLDAMTENPPPVTNAVADDDLESLLDAMSEEGFADRRFALLRGACAEAHVTVAQAIALIDAFEFGTDKVEAGAYLSQRISDPENFHRVYGALDFETDKDALRRRVE